ncbi:hypothetical protein GCM10028798_20740 [Humibacter antri]
MCHNIQFAVRALCTDPVGSLLDGKRNVFGVTVDNHIAHAGPFGSRRFSRASRMAAVELASAAGADAVSASLVLRSRMAHAGQGQIARETSAACAVTFEGAPSMA